MVMMPGTYRALTSRTIPYPLVTTYNPTRAWLRRRLARSTTILLRDPSSSSLRDESRKLDFAEPSTKGTYTPSVARLLRFTDGIQPPPGERRPEIHTRLPGIIINGSS